MSLSPKTKRGLWVSAIVLVILIALGAWFYMDKFFREEKESLDEEEHFNMVRYGAEANAASRISLAGFATASFPISCRTGAGTNHSVLSGRRHEIPVGFSKKVVGFERITNNCVQCATRRPIA